MPACLTHYQFAQEVRERLHLTELEPADYAWGAQGPDFLFCHRSYLVNLRRVSRVGRQDIGMEGGALVPVSRRMYNEVNDRFIRAFVGPGLTE